MTLVTKTYIGILYRHVLDKALGLICGIKTLIEVLCHRCGLSVL